MKQFKEYNLKYYFNKSAFRLRITSLPLVLFFAFVTFQCFKVVGEQQFSFLAQSFLQGKLYFLEITGYGGDTVYLNGHYYWPLGPFPAVLLIPFVYIFKLFGSFFYQGYLQFFLIWGVFFLVSKISRILKYSYSESVYLSIAFCVSSVFLGVALMPLSWFFSQVTTVFLSFLIIYEFLTKKRYWLIGLIAAMLMATRITASIFILFFIFDILFIYKEDKKEQTKNILGLLLPVLITIVILGFYNYFRFGDFFEQGYSLQNLSPALTKARSYGIISLKHLPGNIYYFLISMPLPVLLDKLSPVLKFPYIRANPWGISILVTSPYFIYLFFLSYKDKMSKALLGTIFLTALPIFLYYGIGVVQFGYRYSLDFLPALFFLLIRNYKSQYKSLSSSIKSFIIISSFTNFYLFLTLYFF
jgi:hypothetical protein